jgi:hypothetical protein
MKSNLLIPFLLLINNSLFAQKKEPFLLLNYTIGYDYLNVQTNYPFSDLDDIIIDKSRANSVSFFPSFSFGIKNKRQNILEFELNHFSIKNDLKKNPILQNTEKVKDFRLGVRSSYCLKLNSKTNNSNFHIGPEILLYNGKFNLNHYGIKPSNFYAANIGLSLKYRAFSNKVIFFQSNLIIEPLKFTLNSKQFQTINIFQKKLNENKFKEINEIQQICENCDFIQFKLSVGANI